MVNHLTGEQIRVVATEINAWINAAYPEESQDWHIVTIEHLFRLQDEVYRVTFSDEYQSLFVREDGSLRRADTWSYHVAHNFEDMHHSTRQASTLESALLCAVCGRRAPESNRCPGCRAFFCDNHYQAHLDENAQFLKSIGTEGKACS